MDPGCGINLGYLCKPPEFCGVWRPGVVVNIWNYLYLVPIQDNFPVLVSNNSVW